MELAYPTLEKEHKSTQVMFLGRDILVLPVTPHFNVSFVGNVFELKKRYKAILGVAEGRS